MSKTKPTKSVNELAEQLLSLPTAQKLVMASMLVRSGKLDVAESVARAALDDLQARRLLGVERAPLQ